MIYGYRRMIYLLRKHDIISASDIWRSHISYPQGISYAKHISSALADIIERSVFCQVDKRHFFHGGPSGTRSVRCRAPTRPRRRKTIPRIVFLPRAAHAPSFSSPLGFFHQHKRHPFGCLLCWWAIRDSNPGPTGYEPVALTN